MLREVVPLLLLLLRAGVPFLITAESRGSPSKLQRGWAGLTFTSRLRIVYEVFTRACHVTLFVCRYMPSSTLSLSLLCSLARVRILMGLVGVLGSEWYRVTKGKPTLYQYRQQYVLELPTSSPFKHMCD